MKFKPFYLLLLIPFFSSVLCEREDVPCISAYNEAPFAMKVNPNQSLVSRGDTIWLSSDFATNVLLTDGVSSVTIDSLGGYVRLWIMRMNEGTGSIYQGYHDFDLINQVGQLVQYGDDEKINLFQGYLEFTCPQDTCKTKIGLVPKAGGFYCLALDWGRFSTGDTTNCPPKNEFRANVFDVADFNREIFANLNIHFPLKFTTAQGQTRGVSVVNSNGAYAFEVN